MSVIDYATYSRFDNIKPQHIVSKSTIKAEFDQVARERDVAIVGYGV